MLTSRHQFNTRSRWTVKSCPLVKTCQNEIWRCAFTLYVRGIVSQCCEWWGISRFIARRRHNQGRGATMAWFMAFFTSSSLHYEHLKTFYTAPRIFCSVKNNTKAEHFDMHHLTTVRSSCGISLPQATSTECFLLYAVWVRCSAVIFIWL